MVLRQSPLHPPAISIRECQEAIEIAGSFQAGSRTNAGEDSIPRKESSFWKSLLMNCKA